MSHQQTRRDFIKASAGVAAGVLAFCPHQATASESKLAEPAAMAALRKSAIRRRRRLIYNNDGDDAAEPGADTPEGFLSKRSRPLLGTQVDSVFYCTGVTTMFSHLAKVGENYGEFCHRVENDPNIDMKMARLFAKNIAALKAAGHDTLATTADFCHRNRLEVFFSHRINDRHDTFRHWEFSRWKREHPQFLLGKKENMRNYPSSDPRYWWSVLDFEQPEVRDYLCRIQEDVCDRYDVDGMDIDYFRAPMFFRPNLDRRPATPEQVEIMTDFQRRLRDIHLRAGTKRGRPILTSVRTPVTLVACRHVGIDIRRWLSEGLIDLLIVGGGYVPFTQPLEEIVDLAHGAGVPAYPTISESGMRGPDKRYGSVEAWRGAASNIWQAGADGIMSFNLFPSEREPRFMDIGSPETLANRDKLFVIEPDKRNDGVLSQSISQSQLLPITIPGDGKPVTAALPIGDDLPAAGKHGSLKSANLWVHLSDGDAVENVEMKLNGAPLTPIQRDAKTGWITCRPLPEQYQPGRNDLSFRMMRQASGVKAPVDIIHVEAKVSYAKS